MPRGVSSMLPDGRRLCSKCGEVKDLGEFPRNTAPNGTKTYSGYCKTCHRAYKEAHREKAKIDNHKLYERDKEKFRERSRLWNEQNPERAKSNNVAWRKNNPDKPRAANARRRAKILGNGREPYTWAEICERDAWKCYLCGQAVDPTLVYPDPLSGVKDHVIPLVRGGADSPDNVRLAHARCNRRKWNSTADEVMGLNGFVHGEQEENSGD